HRTRVLRGVRVHAGGAARVLDLRGVPRRHVAERARRLPDRAALVPYDHVAGRSARCPVEHERLISAAAIGPWGNGSPTDSGRAPSERCATSGNAPKVEIGEAGVRSPLAPRRKPRAMSVHPQLARLEIYLGCQLETESCALLWVSR